LKKIFTFGGGLFLIALLLRFPQEGAAGAKLGLDTCLSVLIPSLYPFLVLTVFLVKSGATASFGNSPLGKLIARIFALPQSAAGSILMGMCGGYPAGSRGIEALYEENELTEKEASHALLFCVNAGPAFLCTAVGAGFLRNPASGQLLLCAHLLGGILLGVLLSIRFRGHFSLPKFSQKPLPSPAKALLEAARSAAASMVCMCGFVILFAAFLQIAQKLLSLPQLSVLSSICEVTLGCKTMALSGMPLWCFALATGWGGLCVHLQVLQGLKFKVPLWQFFLCRLLHGILSAVLIFPLAHLFPGTSPVFGSNSATVPSLSGPMIGSAVLLLLCIAVLLDTCSFSKMRKKA
jgi:sporulation integral membrane protein YlbJ